MTNLDSIFKSRDITLPTKVHLINPWDPPGKNTGVGCHFLLQCMKVKSESEVTQSCPTLHDPMDCSLPGSSVHGIFQARVLERGAIAFSFHVLAIVNSAIVNNGVHVCFSVFISSGYQRNGISQEWDCWVIWWLYSQLFKESPYRLPKWLYRFTFPTSNARVFSFLETLSSIFFYLFIYFFFFLQTF